MENTNQEYTDAELTPDDIAKIKARLTEEHFLILKTIYEFPEIQHKVLCEKLGKSANNLSNMIVKISFVEFKLIQTFKDGTKKYYSLTPAGVQYVKQEMFTDRSFSKSGGSVSDSSAEEKAAKVLEALKFFKEKCGPDWRSALYDLLNERDSDSRPEIQDSYNSLAKLLYKYRMQDTEVLEKFFELLEDEELVNRFRHHLNTKFFYFDCLKPLMIREKNINAFKIIDSVFYELHPLVFSPCLYAEKPETLLTSEEYDNLIIGIIKLNFEFVHKHYSKETAVLTWTSSCFLTEELAIYIAEKCSFLMFLCRPFQM